MKESFAVRALADARALILRDLDSHREPAKAALLNVERDIRSIFGGNAKTPEGSVDGWESFHDVLGVIYETFRHTQPVINGRNCGVECARLCDDIERFRQAVEETWAAKETT